MEAQEGEVTCLSPTPRVRSRAPHMSKNQKNNCSKKCSKTKNCANSAFCVYANSFTNCLKAELSPGAQLLTH